MVSKSADRVVQVLRAIVNETRTENVTFMAGSIAYHAFISLLPFLLVILLAISAVGDPELGQRVVRLAGAYLTPNSTGLLSDVIENATRSGSVTVVGIVALVWGAFKIFRSLDTAFSDIYESEHLNTFADQLLDAGVVFGSLGVGVVASVALGRTLGLTGGSTPDVVQSGFVVVVLAVAFFPLYYVFPDEDVSVREVLPGTVFAAVGWTTLEAVFQFYVVVASKSETYGIIGAIILLLTWLYFSGLVVLLGAVINAVLAGRSEDTADLGWDEAAPELAVADRGERDVDPFVVPLRELRDALDDETPLTIRAGETEIDLPPPTSHEMRIATIDRPRILGGYREHADLRFRWEADTPHPDRLRREAAEDGAGAGSDGGDDVDGSD